MAEIALAFVAKLAEYLVDPLVRRGRYLFCARNITKTLETETKKLASTQAGVQTRVQEARNKTEKVVDAVEDWLAEVKSHVDEVQKLQQQLKESNRCFKGRCPTWRRYHLCRKMTKMTEATKNLNQRSEFNPFSILAPLPEIEYLSSGNFVYFQSTKLASDQLLAALQENGVRMIGLYGMGGSGKTTLVTEVGNEAKKLNLFDRVIFTTVSQNLDVKKIQNEFADMLSLEFHEQSEAGRARRLSMRLSNGERILIILDDVWAMIDLKDVGIPDSGGCKVLLTTRLLEVCYSMDCEHNIPLNLLSYEESLTLFQKHARNVDESLDSVAQQIVGECKGLPIAIQAVGASLRGKSIEEWKEALRRLRDSKLIDVAPGIRDAFSCLRLSYDYLRSKEARSLFLMCCMYPEDADIPVEDLFRIAIGLDMCEELGSSLEDARNKVSACINHLVDSCLLMRSEKMKDHLRIHDTVRDAALRISSQENCTIAVNLEKDMKVAADWSIKHCYALASWSNQASQFPQQLDAPKLEILLLNNIGACELSEANFKGMGALKVIKIDSIYFQSIVLKSLLPHSMNLLPNLRTLRLRGCQLGDDLSWVLCLKRLEVLDLKRSSFKHLPEGLEELNKLKLLDIPHIKEQSFKIIERCIELQELYVSRIQLSSTTLNLEQCFSNDATFLRLKRYKVAIGNFDAMFCRIPDIRNKTLGLGGFKLSTLSPFIKYLMQQAEVVCLYRFNGGCKNIAPDAVQVVGGMNELTSLRLDSCLDLECLADATSQHIDLSQVETLFFPKLIKLELEDLANLKEIWRGPPLFCFFEKLRELCISHCPLLTSLVPKNVVRAFLLLQKLTIEGGCELLNIIEEDGDGSNNEIISASNNGYLMFSKLKSLTIIDCNKLQYVFSNSYIQGLEQLEELCIDRASQLKYAFGQHEDVHQDVQIKLPVLRSLQLKGLKNLLSIFPKNFHSSCPCLRELHWVECPKFNASCVNIIASSHTNMDNHFYSRTSASLSFLNLEKLEIDNCSVEDILFAFEREDLTKRNSQNQLIQPLNTMKLKNLLELKLIWSGPMGILSLQNRRKFKVSGCNNLRTIFSPIILKSMPLLEDLEISDCNELEEIMSDTEVGEQHQDPPNAQSPNICFPHLQRLEVQRCNKLKCLFSMAIYLNNLSDNILSNLRRLTLEEMPRLKDFCQGLSLSNDCLPQEAAEIDANGSGNQLLHQPPYLYLESFILRELELQELSELSSICKAFTSFQNLSFHYLHDLTVQGCGKVKCILSMSTWGSLPRLRFLKIIECVEVEEIMQEPSEEVSNSNMPFPELDSITVKGCHKLKCLVKTATPIEMLLPQLKRIEVSEAAQMEELFSHNTSHQESTNVQQVELPNLNTLKLSKLPALTHFCKGLNNLYAPYLHDVQINECPNFDFFHQPTSSQTTALDGGGGEDDDDEQ